MSARVFAFLNFKGGVGKTTNVVNLAACLAYLRGRRVLVVDLDAQCNSTYWLLRPSEFTHHEAGGSPRSRRRLTTWQIFQDAIEGTRVFDAGAAIFRGVPRNEHGTELVPYLHLLPASVDLLDIEFGVDPPALRRLRPALLRALQPLRSDYDFIFLDCPPHLHYVTQAAVLASDHLIVPYNPDYLSLSGFRVLCRLLRRLDDSFRELRPDHARAEVDALIVSRFRRVGNVYGVAVAELKSQIEQMQSAGLLPSACALLEPPIRDDVKVSESASEHKPVIFHAPDSIASQDYMALTASFLQRFPSSP